jgi:hypothetical protein
VGVVVGDGAVETSGADVPPPPHEVSRIIDNKIAMCAGIAPQRSSNHLTQVNISAVSLGCTRDSLMKCHKQKKPGMPGFFLSSVLLIHGLAKYAAMSRASFCPMVACKNRMFCTRVSALRIALGLPAPVNILF